MSCFEVEGNRGGTMTPISEWKLEQHKQFLDTFILIGGDKEQVGVHTALKAELLSLAGCSCRTFFPDFHITSLEILQRRSQALFSSDEVTLDSLYVAPKKMSSSWTLEHHRRVVRAVIQLGGLNSSKTTAEAVLKLMDEEDRRQGLTAKMIEHHLVGLYGLQKETQRLMAFCEKEKEQSFWDLRYLVRKGLYYVLFTKIKENPHLRQHLKLLKQVSMAHWIQFHIIKSEREVLKAFG
ncbi:hypothetical protein ACLB2K_011383 [Fragaria x ananassa]